MTPSSEPRPPGGTTRSRTPGTRTPRKVQWPDEDRSEDSLARQVDSASAAEPSHMLDERGLDPERFRVLTEKLEQHRRETPLQRVHYYPAPEPATPSVHDAENESDISSEDVEPDSLYPSSSASPLAFSPSEPSHDVPDNRISDGEDAGLPGTKDLRRFSIDKAEQYVRAHVKKPQVTRGQRHTRRADPEKSKPHDIESEADTMPSSPEGGGILSALLNLYQHPESAASSSVYSSSQTSSSGYNTPSTEHEDVRPLRKSRKERQAEKRSEKVYHRRPWHLSVPSVFGHVSRPASAKSAAGVFGPLIASTGNLAGVGAPHASQLQPNLNRPGYKLSRYSMETKDIKRPPPVKRRHTDEYSPPSHLPKTESGATTPTTPTPLHSLYNLGSKSNLSSILGGYVSSIRSGRRSGTTTPTDHRSPPSPGLRQRRKRRKAEVFITRHVAHIIRREEFLMKLTRAMMMFGGPSHRLQAQIQSAARVLDIKLSFLYLPDIVLISFDDSATGTSHIKLIRQGSALDLGKLNDAFILYWKVIHDKLSVSDASVQLDVLMKKKPLYNWLADILIGGMCSASICTVSFGGSFIDALVSFPLGGLLVAIQMLTTRNILFSYVFEVTVTTIFSFIAAALATTHKLCYPAVTSSSVVLILPGFLVLTGALELMSRHIIAGSVRLCFSVVYALFLGFGFAIGAELFELFTGHNVFGAEDYTCSLTHHPDGPWYQRTPSKLWAFLTVPLFSAFLSMRNRAPWYQKEIVLLVLIASAGWVTNYYTGRRFVGQSDIIAAVGAFAVGFISNLYSRIFSGNAFVVMITGILFQLPSGLGSGGLLSYASQQAQGSTISYLSGFQTALKLVSVAIGLTIGLGLSLVVTHPIQSRKREAGIFSM
ncbi:DUF1212-domain-containing protein [Pholiota conissans]|uniref:DUF1212-domain-containing protein n=1 Tax=Pholiota conissans TaxID=109636 RepID=A0A9P5YNQ0_9AGAR|nr:DUF1212-domain-containing protein [Pholiota conissans]